MYWLFWRTPGFSLKLYKNQETGSGLVLLQFRSMSMLFWFVHAPMNAAFPWLSAPKVSGKLWGKKRLPQISALLGSFNWKRIVKREWGPSLDQRFGAPKEIQENSQNQSYMVTIIISLYLLMGRSYDPMKKPGVFYRVAFLVFPLWRFQSKVSILKTSILGCEWKIHLPEP